MDTKTIRFSVRDNTTIYRLELAKALLYFTEFDFTYFWEQCIAAGRNARKTGHLPATQVTNAKLIIAKAHPYIEACLNSDFSDIVTDCIIEFICHSDRITTEELWTRCISSKNQYESAIFKRISEYKSNKAINQWVNIVRIQEYARNKMNFIFEPDEVRAVFSKDTIRTRKEYFDLSLSISANELGFPCKQLPSVKISNAASLSNATFVVSKVSKVIYRKYADTFSMAGEVNLPETRDYTYTRDKIALDAYSYVKGLSRPSDMDMKFAVEAIRENPDMIYVPDSFKSIVDLEFDFMYKHYVYIRKCESCSRYFVPSSELGYCDRVNSSGKTCREQYEDLCATILASSPKAAEPIPEKQPAFDKLPFENEQPAAISQDLAEEVSEVKPSEVKPNEVKPSEFRPIEQQIPAPKQTPPPVPVSNPVPVAPTAPAAPPIEAKPEIPAWRLVPPPNKGVPVPKEMEKHGQRIYNALYKRLGKGMDENEFKEWSQYLSNMKRNVKTGDSTVDQLEEFLEYSDTLVEAVKLAGKNRKTVVPTYVKDQFNEEALDAIAKGKMPENKPKVYNEANIKPFSPEAFSSREEAERSEHSDKRFDPNNKPPKKERVPAEVKEPTWERLSREEFLAQQEREAAERGDDDDNFDF